VWFERLLCKPVAIDDGIAVRPVMISTLAADHRVSDGQLGIPERDCPKLFTLAGGVTYLRQRAKG